MGKGDTRRPTQIDELEFERRWRNAFGGEKKSTQEHNRRTVTVDKLPCKKDVTEDAGAEPATSIKKEL
jgi:hypothetical protein